MVPFRRLKALYFASFGHLGAGWAQKSPQGLQKTHFGSVLGAISEDLGHILPIFGGRGWDSSLKVCLRLLEDYVEYLMRFLGFDLSLSGPMSVSLSLYLYLSFPVALFQLFPSLPLSLLEAHAAELCLPPGLLRGRGRAKRGRRPH